MCHHTAEQQKAWEAVAATLDDWCAARSATQAADEAGDDAAYPALLAAELRAEREFDGAWAHYHAI